MMLEKHVLLGCAEGDEGLARVRVSARPAHHPVHEMRTDTPGHPICLRSGRRRREQARVEVCQGDGAGPKDSGREAAEPEAAAELENGLAWPWRPRGRESGRRSRRPRRRCGMQWRESWAHPG